MKIGLFGKGFIGQRILDYFNCSVTNAKNLTVEKAMDLISSMKCSVVINAIGYTGETNVDDCETDVGKTLEANSFVPLILAEACYRTRTRLVHLSSACIFHYNYERDNPKTENSKPDFTDLFYSRSKIYSDQALAHMPHVLVARIRVPLDDRPHPRNILTKLLTFKRIIDVKNSITYIPDMLKCLNYLIEAKASGIYNVVADGAIRYTEILRAYEMVSGTIIPYKIIPVNQLGLFRTNVILDTFNLRLAGYDPVNIYDILVDCIRSYVARSVNSNTSSKRNVS